MNGAFMLCYGDVELDVFIMKMEFQRVDDTAAYLVYLFSNQFVQCKLEPGSDLDPACKRAPSAGLLETFPVSREMGLPPYNPTVEGRKTRQRGFSQSQAWILTTPKL